ELALSAGLALVDLRTLGVDAEHDRLARRRDGLGERLRSPGRSDQGREQQGGGGKLDEHGGLRKGFQKKKRAALKDAARDDVRPSRAKLRTAQAANAFVRFSATLSRKPVVESQRWSAPTSSARSLVMKPDSTVSTQTRSSVVAKFAS